MFSANVSDLPPPSVQSWTGSEPQGAHALSPHPFLRRYHQARSRWPPSQPCCRRMLQERRGWGDKAIAIVPFDWMASRSDATADWITERKGAGSAISKQGFDWLRPQYGPFTIRSTLANRKTQNLSTFF